jgi:hypothetical protein
VQFQPAPGQFLTRHRRVDEGFYLPGGEIGAGCPADRCGVAGGLEQAGHRLHRERACLGRCGFKAQERAGPWREQVIVTCPPSPALAFARQVSQAPPPLGIFHVVDVEH